MACLCILFWIGWPAALARTKIGRGVRKIRRLDWIDADHGTPAGTKYRTFFSPTIGRSVSYLVYLPPDYDTAKEKRYPVIYWLHSLGGDQREGSRFFVPLLDEAIRSRKAPATIAVLVHGLGGSRWLNSPDGKRPVERVIINDLIPHVDATYRTIADRRTRGVEGFSMGGFGAPHLGFKYPEMFGAVSILSGALYDDRQTQDYLENDSAWGLLARNADAIRGRTFIRIIVGDQDGLFELNRKYHQLLDTLKIDHEYIVMPGIGHREDLLYKRLGPAGLAFYLKAFHDGSSAEPPATASRGLTGSMR